MIEFVLVFMMGIKVIDQTQIFQDINRCLYFAERLNKQPPVPNRRGGEDVPKTMSYTAVCEVKFIDPSKVSVYK